MFLLVASLAQATPSIGWNTFLGANSQHLGYDVDVDSSGNVYTVGLTNKAWDTGTYGNPVDSQGFQGGVTDGVLAKLDSSGEVTWYKHFGGSSNDAITAVHIDSSNNVYVVGYAFGAFTNVGCTPVHGYVGGSIDGFVAKLDSDGAVTWCTYLGSSSNDYLWAVDVDASGNVYVGGESYSVWHNDFNNVKGTNKSSNGYQGVIAKLDSDGDYVMHRFLTNYTVSGVEPQGDHLYTVKRGSYYSGGWNYPAQVGKYDLDDFDQDFSTNIGSGEQDGFGIVTDSSENVFVVGYGDETFGSPVRAYSGSNDIFVAKLNSSGTLQWNTFLGSSSNDQCRDDHECGIVLDSEGSVYVTGYSAATWGTPERSHSGSNDAYVAKLNGSGALQWNAFYGGSNSDQAIGMAIDSSDDLYFAGWTQQTSWGSPVDFPSSCYYCHSVVKLTNSLNAAPVMTPMNAITVGEGAPITVTGTCSDDDGDDLTITTSQTSGTSCGTISGSPDNGTSSSASCTAPFVNSNATLVFSLACTDGSATDTETVNVTVNAAPTAVAQSKSTSEETAVTITLGGTDPSDSIASISIVTEPENGELSNNPPNVTYTPDDDFSGEDSFTFIVNDGIQNSAPATVTLNVSNQNDPPRIVQAPSVRRITPTSGGVEVDLPEITATDPDSDDFSFTWEQVSGEDALQITNQGKVDLSNKPKKGAYYVRMKLEDEFGAKTYDDPIRIDVPNNPPERTADDEDVPNSVFEDDKYYVNEFSRFIDIETLFSDPDDDNVSLDWTIDVNKDDIENIDDIAGFISTSSDGSSRLRIRMAGEVRIVIEANDGDGGTTTEEIVLDIPVPDVTQDEAQLNLTQWQRESQNSMMVTGSVKSPVWPVVIVNGNHLASVTLADTSNSNVNAAINGHDDMELFLDTEIETTYETYNFTATNVTTRLASNRSAVQVDMYTNVNGSDVPLLSATENLSGATQTGSNANGVLSAGSGCSLLENGQTGASGFAALMALFGLILAFRLRHKAKSLT